MIPIAGERCRTPKPDESGPTSRLSRIREQLGSGYYDSPAIIHETARRILRSGDL